MNKYYIFDENSAKFFAYLILAYRSNDFNNEAMEDYARFNNFKDSKEYIDYLLDNCMSKIEANCINITPFYNFD